MRCKYTYVRPYFKLAVTMPFHVRTYVLYVCESNATSLHSNFKYRT